MGRAEVRVVGRGQEIQEKPHVAREHDLVLGGNSRGGPVDFGLTDLPEPRGGFFRIICADLIGGGEKTVCGRTLNIQVLVEKPSAKHRQRVVAFRKFPQGFQRDRADQIAVAVARRKVRDFVDGFVVAHRPERRNDARDAALIGGGQPLAERFQPGAVGKIFERGPRHRVEPRVGQHFFELGEFRHVAGLQSLKRGLGLRVQFVLRLRRRGKAKREKGNHAK